jgi:hypothetical protein
MAIEIKDLNLASEQKDLQGEFLDSSTALRICGGYWWSAAAVLAKPSVPGSNPLKTEGHYPLIY